MLGKAAEVHPDLESAEVKIAIGNRARESGELAMPFRHRVCNGRCWIMIGKVV